MWLKFKLNQIFQSQLHSVLYCKLNEYVCCYWSKIFIMRQSQFLPTLVLFYCLRWRVFTLWDFAFLLHPLRCIYSIQNLTGTLLETLCTYIAQILMQNSNICFFKFLGLVLLTWQFWISQSILHLWSGLK